MGHFILEVKRDRKIVIDHINGNALDNRRCNLRVVTHLQNQWNRGGKKKSTSQYKGVSWSGRNNKWIVNVYDSNRKANKYVGLFNDEKNAAVAYNEAVKQYY